MLKHTTGDLLVLAESGEFDVILHGCNCFNTMGGGIARQIREQYPVAARVDAETRRGDYNKLGNWTESQAGDYFDNMTFGVSNKRPLEKRFTILNCYTQYNMSTGQDVFEYTAFQLILEKLLHTYGDKRMGMPYIGMGLAGGDFARIMPMIENFAIKIAERGGSVTLVRWV